MLYNTTTTIGAHSVTLKTTSRRKKTSWPLAFTSTTSTSRMESATCSTYHNHVYRHLQSSMALHLHSQNGLVNFEHTSTSASLSTSTSWTFAHDAEEPLTTDIMVQQTPAGHRQHPEIARLTQTRQDLRDERTQPVGDPARRDNNVIDNAIQQVTQDLNAKSYFRMLLQQEYVEQVNFLATSSCMRQSPTANQTTYYVDFSEPTSVGKRTDI